MLSFVQHFHILSMIWKHVPRVSQRRLGRDVHDMIAFHLSIDMSPDAPLSSFLGSPEMVVN